MEITTARKSSATELDLIKFSDFFEKLGLNDVLRMLGTMLDRDFKRIERWRFLE